MSNAVFEDTLLSTGSRWLIEDGNVIVIRFGEKREDQESAAAEILWLEEKFQLLQSQFPQKHWSILLDFSKLALSQSTPFPLEPLFSSLLKNDKIIAVAIVQASHSFQVAIRKLLFKLTRETGRLKFFEQKEMAREWLKIKQITNNK